MRPPACPTRDRRPPPLLRAITCDPVSPDEFTALSDIDLATNVACYEPRGALMYLNADGLEEQMSKQMRMMKERHKRS